MADSGDGTLRACLSSASAGETILFDTTVFPSDAPVVINLLTPLPSLTQGGLTLDGANAGVMIDGSNIAPSPSDGIVVASDHNTVRGLQLQNFSGFGLRVTGSANVIGAIVRLGVHPSAVAM
ncbi:MAG: hypothetical protein IPK16_31805 [Anaerolineales bacterium]|nr:hypothetical protein [Anaerolineales bacterium]